MAPRQRSNRGLLGGEFWIHEARDDALALACRRFGLEESYGRGFDALPLGVREPLARGLVGNLTAGELRRAVAVVLGTLLREASDTPEVERVRPIVRELAYSASA